MEIMVGDSREVSNGQWSKIDLHLDNTDFQKLLVEFELVGVPCSTTQQFVIMELEAQWLIAWQLLKRHNHGTVENARQLMFARDQKILELEPDEQRRQLLIEKRKIR